jgi:hypothetical protein
VAHARPPRRSALTGFVTVAQTSVWAMGGNEGSAFRAASKHSSWKQPNADLISGRGPFGRHHRQPVADDHHGPEVLAEVAASVAAHPGHGLNSSS